MHLRTVLLSVLGSIFLGLGAIGLLIPIWPTTPFVLLSAACFSSAPQIRTWIMRIAFFREHVENYERRTGLSRKNVRISLIWLWGMLLISMALLHDILIRLMLFLIGSAVTIHILLMSKSRVRKK